MHGTVLSRVVAVVLLAGAFAVSGCGGGTSAPPDTLVFARGADSEKLDPHATDNGESVVVCTNIYEGLLRYKRESAEIEPCLATGFTVSDDRLRITFTLREGVQFHDGSDFNAEVVKANIERNLPNTKSAYVFPEHAMAHASWFANVSGVETPDAKTAVLVLSQPDVAMIQILASYAGAMVSLKALKTNADAVKAGKKSGPEFVHLNPVGTGPFIFKSWSPGEVIRLTRNDKYWGDKAKSANLIFKVVPDNATRRGQLEAGEVHIIDGINDEDVPSLKDNTKLKVYSDAMLSVCYVFLNTTKAPFDNAKVRDAVAWAVDKKAILELYYGQATPAVTMMPPSLGAITDLKDRSVDIEKAKGLLAESGLPKEQWKATLNFMDNPRGYIKQPAKVATKLKEQLAAIGFDLTLAQTDWNTHLTACQSGEPQCGIMGWMADYPDPDNFLYVLLHGSGVRFAERRSSNFSGFNDEQTNEWLVAAKSEFDPVKRAALYLKTQERIFREAPVIPLVHTNDTIATAANVTGFVLHPVGIRYLAPVAVATPAS
jgi:peptide/nickel transport system substrate-binding protein